MSGRRKIFPQRPRIYIGCEGKSEVAYIALMRDLCGQRGIKLTFEIDDLSAGDPLSRVEEALRRATQKERAKAAFASKFLIIDDDQCQLDANRAQRAKALAARSDLIIIWQRPCHEGFLLRHIAGHQHDDPQTCAFADQALTTVWPEYAKPMEKRDLARRLDSHSLDRAVAVEPEFAVFLAAIGW